VEGESLNEIYDLGVIGGGPAGASAAITAAQLGLRVLLLEAGAFPRHKVCGEFVSAEALSILEGLLGRDTLVADNPRISKARILVDDHVAELSISPAALSLCRYQLDFGLWQKAADTGVFARERSAVKEARRTGELFALLTDDRETRVRAVIDASGRWSKLRSLKPSGSDSWIGLKGHFHEEALSDSCDLYFFRGGYCGVQPLGDGRVNAAAMVRADVARSLAGVFAQHRDLEIRSRKWKRASEPVSTAPIFFAPPTTNDRGMALAGDAAAFIDPFAGDGISIALHSGRMAALALSRYLRSECSLPSALQDYDCQYRDFVEPALKNAARLRRLLQLPKALRVGAVSLLNFPMVARAAIQQTRIRRVG